MKQAELVRLPASYDPSCIDVGDEPSCWRCGYHVCSCKPEPPQYTQVAEAEHKAMQVAHQEPTPTRVALMSPLTGKPYVIHCKLCGVADGEVHFGSQQHATCPDPAMIARIANLERLAWGVGGRHD